MKPTRRLSAQRIVTTIFVAGLSWLGGCDEHDKEFESKKVTVVAKNHYRVTDSSDEPPSIETICLHDSGELAYEIVDKGVNAGLDRVEVYENGTLIKTQTAPEFVGDTSARWTGCAYPRAENRGTYKYEVRAYDRSNQETVSEPIIIDFQ